ncbi:hypothetical protein [uncultured Chitinophaga sp.]|uniref:hypothetical protein n=1 Tax=uncultured Chitinophaga sp. TaxID=339340 RepID=UPI0025CFC0C4|nr:hypothetical protein [uncultured Chitinophaga sp.]
MPALAGLNLFTARNEAILMGVSALAGLTLLVMARYEAILVRSLRLSKALRAACLAWAKHPEFREAQTT